MDTSNIDIGEIENQEDMRIMINQEPREPSPTIGELISQKRNLVEDEQRVTKKIAKKRYLIWWLFFWRQILNN